MDINALPLDTPALSPPPGDTSNFQHPSGIQGRIHAILIFCLVISTIFVWSRLYTRFFINKSHGWDDYTSFIAWACDLSLTFATAKAQSTTNFTPQAGFVGYIALTLVASRYGSGVHQWHVRLHDFMTWAKLASIIDIYYNPLIFVSKLSILLQFKRVFVPAHSGKTYWLIHFLIWSNLIFYLSVMLLEIMKCLPREKVWNPTMQGRCIDLPFVPKAGAVVNIISDFSILVLPIGKIWQLQMSQKRKLGISTVFSTGLFACVSSVFRLVNLVKFPNTDDVTFYSTPVALWMMAEVATGIVCGCLPVLPQLFRHYIPKIRKSLTALRGKSQSRCKDSHRLQGPRPDTWNQISVQGKYLELDEHGQSKEDMGKAEKSRKQDASSERHVATYRNLFEERPAMEQEIYV